MSATGTPFEIVTSIMSVQPNAGTINKAVSSEISG